jgi:hypothetical protein
MSKFPVGLGLLLLLASLALFAPQSFPGVSVRCTSNCDIVIIVGDCNHDAVLSILGSTTSHGPSIAGCCSSAMSIEDLSA